MDNIGNQTVQKYQVTVEDLKIKFLGAKAKHKKFGEGVITLVGTSHGVPWIEVAFRDFRKLFSAPFDKLVIAVNI